MKQADLEKKKEEEAAAKEKEINRLKLADLFQECKKGEEEARQLKEAENERDELLNTPLPLVILEAVTAEEPTTSTATGSTESTLESTISMKYKLLSPERVSECFKSLEEITA